LAVGAKRHPELVLAIGEVMRIASTLGLARVLPPVLTIDEVAEVLNLDRKTVFRCIDRRELPGVRRFGKAVRVSTEALMTWMSKGRGDPSR
jgi:excisionase family DNA binding protein